VSGHVCVIGIYFPHLILELFRQCGIFLFFNLLKLFFSNSNYLKKYPSHVLPTYGYFWLESGYDEENCGQWDADIPGHVELPRCPLSYEYSIISIWWLVTQYKILIVQHLRRGCDWKFVLSSAVHSSVTSLLENLKISLYVTIWSFSIDFKLFQKILKVFPSLIKLSNKVTKTTCKARQN
jgi:hypothetical protein